LSANNLIEIYFRGGRDTVTLQLLVLGKFGHTTYISPLYITTLLRLLLAELGNVFLGA